MYRRMMTIVVLIMLPFLNFNCIDDDDERVNCPSWKNKNIEFFVKKLSSSNNVKHRGCAALRLGWIGEPAAKRGLPALIQALTDEHYMVRSYAARALDDMGSASVRAVPALIERLNNDKDGKVINDVARTLGRIGPAAKDAVPALIKLAQKNRSDRYLPTIVLAVFQIDQTAFYQIELPTQKLVLMMVKEFMRFNYGSALQVVDDRTMVSVLIEALGDEDSLVRYIAASALGRMDPTAQTAVPALTAALNDTFDDVRYYAAIALGEIRENVPLQALIAVLRDVDSDVARQAAKALGKIRDPAAVPALIETLVNEGQAIDLTVAAALALGEIGDPSATQPLLKTLRQAKSPDLRISAALALGEIGDPSATQPLLKTLRQAKSPDLRISAALALYRVNRSQRDTVIHTLIDELQPGKESSNRVNAASALYRVDPSQRDVVVASLIDLVLTKPKRIDYDHRINAAKALGEMGEAAHEAAPVLINRTMSPSTYGLGRAIDDAIVRIGEPSVPKLIKTLTDKRWLIYSTSFDLLKRIGTPEAMKAIEGFEGR